MPAPLGNQFWKLRAKHGRDKIFQDPKLLKEAMHEFYATCDNNPLHAVEQTRSGFGKKKVEVGQEGIKEEPTGLIEMPLMRPYTMAGLCVFLGVNTKYFNDFKDSLKGKTDQLSKDFSEVLAENEDVMYNQKFTGATVGLFKENIIARDLGLKDKSEVDNKHTGQVVIERNVKSVNEG